MKQKLEVTMTFDIELDIADDRLTKEAIVEFQNYMFDLDDDKDELFKYVATQFVNQSDPDFVEGVGVASWVKYPKDGSNILYNVTNIDVFAEVKS